MRARRKVHALNIYTPDASRQCISTARLSNQNILLLLQIRPTLDRYRLSSLQLKLLLSTFGDAVQLDVAICLICVHIVMAIRRIPLLSHEMIGPPAHLVDVPFSIYGHVVNRHVTITHPRRTNTARTAPIAVVTRATDWSSTSSPVPRMIGSPA